MYLGYQNGKIKFYTEEMLNPSFYELDRQEYTDKEYVLDGDEYVLKDEAWEAKQAQKEAERIAKLNLTGADVERGIYQAKGMDFDDIIALVEHLSKGELDLETGEIINKSVDIDVKALKIELKANHFYRGNPYVSAIGALLGFTEEQLDKFFETNDYTVLLPAEEPIVSEMEIVEEPDVNNSEPVEEENSDITGLEGDEV